MRAAQRAEARRQWVARIATRHSLAIRSHDPTDQRRMHPWRSHWLKWTEGDADVVWVFSQFEEGIHRHDLPALVGDANIQELRRAFIATLAWGAGDTHRYYGRHAEALASTLLPTAPEQSHQSMAAGESAGAWAAMQPVPGMTFRFFTKWLWVLGAHTHADPAPLTFDERVRSSLRFREWPWGRGEVNDRTRWIEYCADAKAIATAVASVQVCSGASPVNRQLSSEWVEYWLFEGASVKHMTLP